MEDEHPRFTGNDWLDGVIWGCAAKATKCSAKLVLSDVPFPIIERICGELERLEFEIDFVETPNAITRQVDLRLIIASVDPIFSNLPKYLMRRVLVTHPAEFIDGFILMRISPFRRRESGVDSSEFDVSDLRLRVRPGSDRDAISEILDNRAVEYRCLHGVFEIDPGCCNKHPFDTYMEGLTSEFHHFGAEVGDDESLLEQMEERIRARPRINEEDRDVAPPAEHGVNETLDEELTSMTSEQRDSSFVPEWRRQFLKVKSRMCPQCGIRPVSYGRFCTIECAEAHLKSERLTDDENLSSSSVSESASPSVAEARDDLTLREGFPGSAIIHLAHKATKNSLLTAYERAALYSIGRRKRWENSLSAKQEGFLEGLLWKTVHLGLVSMPCDVDGCELCAYMQEVLMKRSLSRGQSIP